LYQECWCDDPPDTLIGKTALNVGFLIAITFAFATSRTASGRLRGILGWDYGANWSNEVVQIARTRWGTVWRHPVDAVTRLATIVYPVVILAFSAEIHHCAHCSRAIVAGFVGPAAAGISLVAVRQEALPNALGATCDSLQLTVLPW
jgi:hypothetical protein